LGLHHLRRVGPKENHPSRREATRSHLLLSFRGVCTYFQRLVRARDTQLNREENEFGVKIVEFMRVEDGRPEERSSLD
jgi:hypothetical protein